MTKKGGGGGGQRSMPHSRALGAPTVDVVEARDAALDTKVLVIVHAQLLAGQLLQAVGVLGLRGPGVGLHQAAALHRDVELLELGVDAGGGGVEEALHADLAGRLHDVEGDHGVVVHDDRVVGLDEAHAAHVGRQVEHVVGARHHRLAVVKDAQVHQVELVAKRLLLRRDRVVGAGRWAANRWAAAAVVADAPASKQARAARGRMEPPAPPPPPSGSAGAASATPHTARSRTHRHVLIALPVCMSGHRGHGESSGGRNARCWRLRTGDGGAGHSPQPMR